MTMPKLPGGNLEDRLALISQMLEEAVALLRNTMADVRHDEEDRRDDTGEQRPR